MSITTCPTCGCVVSVEDDRCYPVNNEVAEGISSTEPRKTWLDECAMMAMAAMSGVYQGMGCTPTVVAKESYEIADAMLSEKMKREAAHETL